MCSSTTTADGREAPITTVHPDIIQSHILNRLDGQTLASATCVSPQFLSLCSDDLLWRQICNSTWPATTHPTVRSAIAAFPSAHRSFYSDSFPSVRLHTNSKPRANRVPDTTEFISAVDIRYDDVLIYSKVTVTETLSSWFLSSPLRIELLSHKETLPTPLTFDGDEGACMELAKERLSITWILIDPSRKRAVNIASTKAVEARRHWLTEDGQLRYATVVYGGDGELAQCAVVVNCGGEEGGELQVREVSMQVEDIEGKILNGFEGLGIIETVMEGQRWKRDTKLEGDIYRMFLVRKVNCIVRKQKRERSLDMMCMGTGVFIFLAICTFFLSA